ncbi:transglutaminase [Salipiger aestuarii]|uniref:Transglutaminase-like putative cysteine protease n=1 Tax=Salipiger aestuarii TaxID=568098 RepID=A0A327YQA8_9RHOB|nr:transglutaminase family protein [Salipiger aestuarii]EIE48913.1 transglutaminase domain-containing protein [Citreicella sp. 357]KAA8610335.1 transglutaminase [Salipiger aestuarii]KAB2543554.1 transglutaminase [Salipiger aestuarii]RAK21875.1 transglutaminase-like putative cysteine protease [Salipiger aestuarii]
MSQIYDIRLRIAYSYDSPAAAQRTLLRILPRNIAGQQQLLSGVVTSDPAPDYRLDDIDFFGNPTVEVAHEARLSEVDFQFEGRVLRHAPGDGLDLSCGLRALPREIAQINSIAPTSPHHFLGASPRLRHEPEIAAFARECVSDSMSTLEAAEALSLALNTLFDFDSGATEVTTTPIDAFRARRGVCQDISQVMITALREIGIPAGYVSGFLRTLPPEGQPRLEGADAMHAWVRAWCGTDAGWVEFDPTNAIRAGLDHVIVGFGRDYSDVAPSKGSLRSEGGHDTRHMVDVVPVDERAPA